MTEAEWLADLADLRTSGGTSRSWLARWWAVREVANTPPALLLLRMARARLRSGGRRGAEGPWTIIRYDIGLYAIDAPRGAAPTVLVPVSAGEPVPSLAQGQRVVVTGEPEAGRAVIVETGAHRFEPIGPCVVPVWHRRKHRL